MNTIVLIQTVGFGITIQRQSGHRRHYSPSVASFGRYVDTLKRMGWSEKRLGYGMSLRMPPSLARSASNQG